ncbi:hypothetical protein B0H19DRAFT_1079597 [Mycena capillaripes]|nr:hypothetical protein B0H19DRAFT_1079597 [Mycena capillaripes]
MILGPAFTPRSVISFLSVFPSIERCKDSSHPLPTINMRVTVVIEDEPADLPPSDDLKNIGVLSAPPPETSATVTTNHSHRMRVTVVDEVEPVECRPHPPLPADGPILLEVTGFPMTTGTSALHHGSFRDASSGHARERIDRSQLRSGLSTYVTTHNHPVVCQGSLPSAEADWMINAHVSTPYDAHDTILSTALDYASTSLLEVPVCPDMNSALLAEDCEISTVPNERLMSVRYGGGARQTINGRLLAPYMVNNNEIPAWVHMEYAFEFQCERDGLPAVLQRHKNCVAVDMPLSNMMDLLTKSDILSLSKLHDVWIPARMKVQECKNQFDGHGCSGCSKVVSIFCNVSADSQGRRDPDAKPLAQHGRFKKPKKIRPTTARIAFEALTKKITVEKLKANRKRRRGTLKNTSFPPRPLTVKDAHRIISSIARL